MRLILEVLCDYSGKLAFHLTINQEETAGRACDLFVDFVFLCGI